MANDTIDFGDWDRVVDTHRREGNDILVIGSARGDSFEEIVANAGIGETSDQIREKVVQDIGVVFHHTCRSKISPGNEGVDIFQFPINEVMAQRMEKQSDDADKKNMDTMIESLFYIAQKESSHHRGIISMAHKAILGDRENIFYGLKRSNNLGLDNMYECLQNIFKDAITYVYAHLSESRAQERREEIRRNNK